MLTSRDCVMLVAGALLSLLFQLLWAWLRPRFPRVSAWIEIPRDEKGNLLWHEVQFFGKVIQVGPLAYLMVQVENPFSHPLRVAACEVAGIGEDQGTFGDWAPTLPDLVVEPHGRRTGRFDARRLLPDLPPGTRTVVVRFHDGCTATAEFEWDHEVAEEIMGYQRTERVSELLEAALEPKSS